MEKTEHRPSLSTPLKMGMMAVTMRRGGFFIVSLRLMTLLTFVSYLFVGVSFALVVHSACHHCQHAQNGHQTPDAPDANHHSSAHTSVQPGDSCPISSSGRHCDNCHSKNDAGMTLCTGGTLHHEQGEVVSIAKFVVSPVLGMVDEFPVRIEARVKPQTVSTFSPPPPGRPPSFSFLSV